MNIEQACLPIGMGISNNEVKNIKAFYRGKVKAKNKGEIEMCFVEKA